MRDWMNRWKWFGLAVLLLFASAGPAGSLVARAYALLGESGVRWIAFGSVLAALAGLVLFSVLRGPRRASPGSLLAILALGLLYLLCLARMAPYPVEKVHFLTYGLLAFLGYRALEKTDRAAPFLPSFCLVSLVGFLDEIWQGLLPSRRYDDRDVLVNLTAGFLGLLLTVLLKRVRPASLLAGLLRRGHVPYLLLWPLAGAVFLYLHAVPLPTGTVQGTWSRVGDCRVREWLRLDPDGRLLWWDEDGNRARGDYRITGNRLEGIYFNNRGIEARNESDCGWRPGLVMDLKIRVDARQLVFLEAPDKPWLRDTGAAAP